MSSPSTSAVPETSKDEREKNTYFLCLPHDIDEAAPFILDEITVLQLVFGEDGEDDIIPIEADDELKMYLLDKAKTQRNASALAASDALSTTSESSVSLKTKRRKGAVIADHLVAGGDKIASLLHKLAGKAAKKVDARTDRKYVNNIAPAKPVVVSDTVKKGVGKAAKGSAAVAKGTQFVIETLGSTLVEVGSKASTASEKKFGDGVVNDSLTALKGGAVGASTVWLAVESSIGRVAKSVIDQGVNAIRHKYGDDAAETTQASAFSVMTVVGSVSALTHHVIPRSVAGQLATESAYGAPAASDGVKENASNEKKEESKDNESNEEKEENERALVPVKEVKEHQA